MKINPHFFARLQKLSDFQLGMEHRKSPRIDSVQKYGRFPADGTDHQTGRSLFPVFRYPERPFIPVERIFSIPADLLIGGRGTLSVPGLKYGRVPADSHRKRRIQPLPGIRRLFLLREPLNRPESVQIEAFRGCGGGSADAEFVGPDPFSRGIVLVRPWNISGALPEPELFLFLRERIFEISPGVTCGRSRRLATSR